MSVHPPKPRFEYGELIRLASRPKCGDDLPERAIVSDIDGEHYELHAAGERRHQWFEIGLIDTYYERES